MGKINNLYNQARKCTDNNSNLCFTKEKRINCHIPRCCGVCPKILDCEDVCTYLKGGG